MTSVASWQLYVWIQSWAERHIYHLASHRRTLGWHGHSYSGTCKVSVCGTEWTKAYWTYMKRHISFGHGKLRTYSMGCDNLGNIFWRKLSWRYMYIWWILNNGRIPRYVSEKSHTFITFIVNLVCINLCHSPFIMYVLSKWIILILCPVIYVFVCFVIIRLIWYCCVSPCELFRQVAEGYTLKRLI